MPPLRLIVPLIAVLLLAAGPSAAQGRLPDPAEAALAARRLHYPDLIRLAVPGLVEDGEAYRTGAAFVLRHIGGDKDQAIEIAAGTTIASPRVRLVQVEGRRRLVMLLDLAEMPDSAEGVALLALFDIGDGPEDAGAGDGAAGAGGLKLLDTANVAYDRFTGFAEPARIVGRHGNDTLVLASSHWNSNQAYLTSVMIDLRGDRLGLVDTVFTFSDQACSYERVQQPRFSAAGTRKKPALKVSVTETVTRRKGDCGRDRAPRAGKRTVSVIYTWQGGRYVRSSDALDRLASKTAERF